MKRFALQITLAAAIFVAGCEVQSGITQKSVEKYQPTPTPERIVPVEEKIDPADVVNADSSAVGPTLFVNEDSQKKTLNCNKYNRVMINGDANEVKINGVCGEVMVNGHRNKISAVAAAEIKTYGSQNVLEYSKYVNGKKPVVTDSSGTNTISKSSESPAAAK